MADVRGRLGHDIALQGNIDPTLFAKQPEDIYVFGVQYFGELLAYGNLDGLDGDRETDRPGTPLEEDEGAGILDISDLSPQEVEALILQLFLEADADHSGFLDRKEFQTVLKSANLNLDDRQVRQVLAEADENEDNVIQYKEFLPVMVDILHSLKAKLEAQKMKAEDDEYIQQEAEAYLLHGLPMEEMEKQLLGQLKKADKQGTGLLGRAEFKEVLRKCDLGLTRKDINLISSSLPERDDNMVEYPVVLPSCMGYLVDLMKDEIVMNSILQSEDSLQGLLLSHFKENDPDGTGLLSLHSVKTIMKELSFQFLGLSTLQLMSLISQAPTTQDGMVQYVQFVPVASSMINNMYSADSMKLRMQAIREVSAGDGFASLAKMDIGALRGLLEEAFTAVDEDGSGQLSLDQVVEILTSVGSIQQESGDQSQFTDAHMRTMFAAIDADESGTVDWFELVNFICDAIEHLEREDYIQQVAQNLGTGPIAEDSNEEEEQ